MYSLDSRLIFISDIKYIVLSSCRCILLASGLTETMLCFAVVRKTRLYLGG